MFLAYYEHAADEKDHVLFNKVRYTKDSAWERLPHFHGMMEIAVGIDGASNIVIKGNKYELRRGTICFMDCMDIHTYRYKEGSERFVIGIPYELAQSALEASGKQFPVYVECGEEFGVICDFLELAYSNWEDTPTYHTGFFNMFLALLMKYYLVDKKKSDDKYDDDWVEIIKYINLNYGKELSAESVAEKFGYSPNYFSSVFNKFMGVNFREYLNFCRIAKYRLLMKENPKINAIKAVEQCGFGSLKSFYRARKRVEEMAAAETDAPNF